MKIKRLTDCLLLLLAAGILAACSSNDDNKENNGTDDGKKVNIAKAVTFKVDFADYNAEQEVGVTRAGNQEEKIGQQVIGLGNRILAQCTLQRDTTKQLKTIATRALPDDTYTMLAYDHTTHTFCGAMSGKVTGGAFVYIGDESMELPVGTYDFVLFNSKVSRSGNLLTVTRANAGDALIGRTTGKVIPASPQHQLVSFTMKHVAAKVKLKLTGYMGFSGIAATLASANATDVPSSSIYDASTGTWSLGTGAAVSENITYGANPETATLSETYTALSNKDLFFMPSTDISKLKLTFTAGGIYNLNVAGKSLPFVPTTPLQLDQNGSYVLNVNLLYRFLYLMSDGTTGLIDKTTFGGGTKTPIAVVLSQSERMAIALDDANGGNDINWSESIKRSNTYNFNSLGDAIFHYPKSGYDETYDASYTTGNVTGNKIKAYNPDFPAFGAAAGYYPGVPYTGPFLKWYLPSCSDFAKMLTTLGFGSAHTNWPYKWYWGLANTAFSQVGGTRIAPQSIYSGRAYWSSTEYNANYAVYVNPNYGNLRFETDMNKRVWLNIRSFAKY